ncbi:MAG: putative branched-chain amino acid transport system carrier protein [Rickettsiaceae bacterium]|jgi:LIVCS family branched-chain amino acid:cation transporter|nr:putative branched-chain amino acid transport system carrier protein [Rickettsiaceae bacterium]
MQQYKSIFMYGFAIFAMFFGSGNLVFPISIGYNAGNNWFMGFLGLFFTGILLPFLGLFVIKLYKGNSTKFFGEAGAIAANIIPFFTLSLLGSFGVIPRCITVAHGGMEYIFPSLGILVFASVFCLLTYVLCLKEHVMIKILGKWMSPILLIALLILIVFGVAQAPYTSAEVEAKKAFMNGFLTGYQTMDLFAAFFFSALIFKQIQETETYLKKDMDLLIYAAKPSIIGSILLGVIYLGFVYLGSHYSDIIIGAAPEHMLPTIVRHVMGSSAAIFIAVAILLSCITTAVALNNIYARYISTTLNLREATFPFILLATTIISFIISLLDFKGIAAFLSPALDASYPGLITLTFMCIITRKFQKLKIFTFWAITIICCWSLYH